MFCNAQQRMPWEAHLCFCRCLWPQRKVKEDDPPYDPSLTREMQRGYQSVSFSDFIEDDGDGGDTPAARRGDNQNESLEEIKERLPKSFKGLVACKVRSKRRMLLIVKHPLTL